MYNVDEITIANISLIIVHEYQQMNPLNQIIQIKTNNNNKTHIITIIEQYVLINNLLMLIM